MLHPTRKRSNHIIISAMSSLSIVAFYVGTYLDQVKVRQRNRNVLETFQLFHLPLFNSASRLLSQSPGFHLRCCIKKLMVNKKHISSAFPKNGKVHPCLEARTKLPELLLEICMLRKRLAVSVFM